MVIKINYTSSDIYVSTNVSPVYVVVSYGGTDGGSAIWGQITGTLSNQTDLQNALNAKFDDPTGTTSQYLRGDGSLATFPTIPSGTVTSVGLTMPSAFNVANSPVTSAGTLAVTGAGLATQYIRGDGQLATFPSTASGGSSVNYYLNGSINASVGGYKQLDNNAIIGSGTNFSLSGNGLIAQFLTDAGNPNRIQIPGGAWNFEMYFQVSSAGGNQKFYIELHKYDGSTFTLIASSSAVPEEITGGTSIDLYLTSLAVPTTTLLTTDRLAIRVYIVDNAVGRTITLHTENTTLCEIITTFSGGVSSLNGLSANTQYFATGTSGTDFAISSLSDTHTFNLPTASATNRGALSSADWSTFNGKVGGTGVSGQVAYWNGTNSQTGSNNLFWDAANARLGIGTTTPSGRVHIVSTTVNDALLVITPNNNSIQYPLFIGGATLTSENYLRANNSNIEFFRNGVAATIRTVGSSNNLVLQSSSDLLLNTNGANERVRIFTTTGNVGINIGATVDGGQRLQVYGDAFVKGSGNTSATTALTVQNSDGTNMLLVNNSGYYKLSGTNGMFLSMFTTSGGTQSINGSNTQFYNYTTTQGATSGAFLFTGDSFVQTSGAVHTIYINKGFIPTSGNASFSNLTITPNNINQTGGANGITRGLYVNPTLTAAADWRSIEWSNNSGYGLYGAGTAPNYLGGDLTVVGVFRETVTTNRQTASYSLVLLDRGKLVEMNVATANNLTVPLDSAVAFPVGTKIDIAQYGAGQTTVVATGGVTVRSAGGALKLAAQYSGATLVKIATNEWYLFGDITV